MSQYNVFLRYREKYIQLINTEGVRHIKKGEEEFGFTS